MNKIVLQEKIKAISEEIRNYPTPIARCDLHLPALLEERAALIARLNAHLSEPEEQPACSPEALWANDGGFHAA